MEELEKIEIKNFSLSYDGMFRVTFKYGDKNYQKLIYLKPIDLFKIIESEVTLNNDIDRLDQAIGVAGVEIKNTTLTLQAWVKNDEITGFLTSSIAEGYQDRGYYLLDCNVKR